MGIPRSILVGNIPPLILVNNPQMKLLQLIRFSRRGSICHDIARCLILREGDNFAYMFLSGKDPNEPVDPRRDAAVGWSPVFKRFEHVPESFLRDIRFKTN